MKNGRVQTTVLLFFSVILILFLGPGSVAADTPQSGKSQSTSAGSLKTEPDAPGSDKLSNRRSGQAPGKKWTDPATGIEMVWIPSGTFTMGSPDSEPNRENDEKQHRVTLSKGFYMQTTEVTQGQWKAVIGNYPSRLQGENLPVENVSWEDVQSFIRKLNTMGSRITYKLPTEAQWEYAARAGTSTPFTFGNCLSVSQANYDGHHPLPGCVKGEFRKKTVSVKTFAPNAWGLYEMHGNVNEWCRDWYGTYPTGSVTDPEGPSSGTIRVLRGGSYVATGMACRSAERSYTTPGYRYGGLGFRLSGN